jgi:hypothetical protein
MGNGKWQMASSGQGRHQHKAGISTKLASAQAGSGNCTGAVKWDMASSGQGQHQHKAGIGTRPVVGSALVIQ